MRFSISWAAIKERELLRRRGAAVVLALLFELLIALLFLFLAPPIPGKKKAPAMMVFGIDAPSSDPEATIKPKAQPKHATAVPQPPAKTLPPPPVPIPVKTPSPPANVLWLTRHDYSIADLSNAPATRPAAPAQGETADTSNDSPTAGHGPHGEILYRAEWYREPTQAQLAGYDSKRARGPGWGEIACKTIPNYRVDDCQELGESPRGSGYAGSVRQAAWQFLVRPPRVGGKYLVGEWVRIRVTYTDKVEKKPAENEDSDQNSP